MPPKLNHQIDLISATAMTSLYRDNRPDNFPICESFDKAAIERLISHPDCVFFRIYYGMKPDLTVHAILVAADKEGNDIIPSVQGGPGHGHGHGHGVGGDGDGDILEDSMRCPVTCPPDSPLNNG